MRKKRQLFIILFLTLFNVVCANKTKHVNGSHVKLNVTKEKINSDRNKRSLLNENEKPFWANRGKKQIDDNPSIDYTLLSKNDFEEKETDFKANNIFGSETPFWGNRGRRSSEENYIDFMSNDIGSISDVSAERYRKQDDGPFWGNRGRRQEEPFWGNRGRRLVSQFWGKGRLEDEPFWGNRGRREEIDPFWGNRGRREEKDPFWGNRGRRQEKDPFWGNRGRREEFVPFWDNRGRIEGMYAKNNKDLQSSMLQAINGMKSNIDYYTRYRRNKEQTNNPFSFWNNRARESKLKYLFNEPRTRHEYFQPNFMGRTSMLGWNAKPPESQTIHDDRIYAEEPHYIIVSRSSRSSAEDDPFFISRGKKKNFSLLKTARDRRGALEEIVKSMRNDPYYIARGKKDSENIIKGNTSETDHNDYVKAKDLVCRTIDLVTVKDEGIKVKREVSDNDRDRRTILNKLAAQLQMDPYFVSRGKKNGANDENVLEFMKKVSLLCD